MTRRVSTDDVITSSELITSTTSGGRSVSLTFDDGPDPVSTPRLLAVLRQHDVKAVFCLWGDHVEAHPEIARQIAADGHTLGNHTMHHEDMSTWSPEAIEAIEADLVETNRVIRRAVPGARIPYFRAPYGAGVPRLRWPPGSGCRRWVGGLR